MIKIWTDVGFFPLAGTFRGVCKKIDHFPEDADYEADAAEYLLRKSDVTQCAHTDTHTHTAMFSKSVAFRALSVLLIKQRRCDVCISCS